MGEVHPAEDQTPQNRDENYRKVMDHSQLGRYCYTVREEDRLCELCEKRPGHFHQVPGLPVSQWLCDECAESSFVLTPGMVLFALLLVGAAVYLLWRFL